MIKAVTFLILFMPLFCCSQAGNEQLKNNIIIDGENRPADGFLPVISDEYSWTYRFFFGFGISSFHERFATDSIWEAGWYFERFRSGNEDGSAEIVAGLYRESAGKLFKKSNTGVEEVLVFDITVLAGDTILLDQQDHLAELYVESTDTVVFADGLLRKRAILKCTEFPDDSGPRIWIEGLGDLSNVNPACILDIGTELACYSNDEGIIYQADWADECWLTTSTTDLDMEQLVLYPNPVKDELQVEVASKAIQTYIISTISGQETMAGTLPSNGVVDVSNLPSGIYILQLRDQEGKRSVSKFVKQ